jgi:hypothetical protein
VTYPFYLRILRIAAACVSAFILIQPLMARSDDSGPPDPEIESPVLLPDRNVSGVFNTELVPKNAFQFDLSNGNIWYGSGTSTNLFTNVVADSLAFLSVPTVSLGGKHNFCDSGNLRCSILMAMVAGKERKGERRLHTASLLQGNVSAYFGDLGRLVLGAGGGTYSSRAFGSGAQGFSDDFYSWLNVAYEFPVTTNWSLGLGGISTLQGLSQVHRGLSLKVRRTDLGGGRVLYARSQFRLSQWVFSLGGVALNVGIANVIAPLIEIHHTAQPQE